MEIPDTLKILGHRYKIIKSSRIRKRDDTTGLCCSNLHEIEIENDTPDSKQAEVLLHEIFEAIIYHLDLRSKLDHTTLSGISEVLFSVIQDNNLNFISCVDGKFNF